MQIAIILTECGISKTHTIIRIHVQISWENIFICLNLNAFYGVKKKENLNVFDMHDN